MVALALPACADEALIIEPAELAELCGETGPVQILALDPARALARVDHLRVVDDRHVLLVSYRGDEVTLKGFPGVAEQELWAVGPCGEAPVLLHEGQPRVIGLSEVWRDDLFVCDAATGDVAIVDPFGQIASRRVFQTTDCDVKAIDEGLLTLAVQDDSTTALSLQRWPDDPWQSEAELETVLGSIRTPLYLSMLDAIGVTDESLFAVTSDDALVEVSRLDATTTSIATGVVDFAVDPSGRWVVWQTAVDDIDALDGPIQLLDRAADVTTPLGDASIRQTVLGPFDYADLGLLHLRRDADARDRFFRLDAELESFDGPSDRWVQFRIGPTRVLVGDWFDGPFTWFDLATFTSGSIFAGRGSLRGTADAMLLVEDVVCCIDEAGNRKAGKLWRVSDEAEPRLLARRATLGFVEGIDGRIITPVEVRSDWTSTLVIVEPETLDERAIASGVLRFSPEVIADVEGDSVVLYTRVDAQEQGVWLARIGA